MKKLVVGIVLGVCLTACSETAYEKAYGKWGQDDQLKALIIDLGGESALRDIERYCRARSDGSISCR